MRVNLYGNVANLAFVWGEYLKRLGVDVTVFLEINPYAASDSLKWEYPNLDKIPEWVRMVDVDLKRFYLPSSNEKKFINELSKCDVIQTFGESAIWAVPTKKPYIYWSYGFDLDVMPFLKGSIKNFILSRMARQALSKAARLIYAMPHQKDNIKKLGLSKAIFYFPLPIDVDRYKRYDEARRRELRQEYNADYIFIHLTRHNWVGQMPDNKRNDILFYAYEKFIKNTKKKTILITVEKGKDVVESKKLISALGIEKYVKWLPFLDKEKVIDFYNIADLNFDQFCQGSWGLLTLEAMSVGVPTFIYIHERCKDFYDELPPVINVSTSEEIFRKMIEFTEGSNGWEDIGKKSRDWVCRHYHWEAVMRHYIEIYQEVVSESRKR